MGGLEGGGDFSPSGELCGAEEMEGGFTKTEP